MNGIVMVIAETVGMIDLGRHVADRLSHIIRGGGLRLMGGLTGVDRSATARQTFYETEVLQSAVVPALPINDLLMQVTGGHLHHIEDPGRPTGAREGLLSHTIQNADPLMNAV